MRGIEIIDDLVLVVFATASLALGKMESSCASYTSVCRSQDLVTICHYWIYYCGTSCSCTYIVGILDTALIVVKVSISYTSQALTVCGVNSSTVTWKNNTFIRGVKVVSGHTFQTHVRLIIVLSTVRLSSGICDSGYILAVIFSMDDIVEFINRTAVIMRDVVIGITHICFTIKTCDVIVLAGQWRVANVLAKLPIRGVI